MIGKTRKFIRETWVELQKATWPWNPKEKGIVRKYRELIDSTIVVLIGSILLAGIISISDLLLVSLISVLVGS